MIPTRPPTCARDALMNASAASVGNAISPCLSSIRLPICLSGYVPVHRVMHPSMDVWIHAWAHVCIHLRIHLSVMLLFVSCF